MAATTFLSQLLSFLSRARYSVTPPTGEDGELMEARCDVNGRLLVSGTSTTGNRPESVSRGDEAKERAVSTAPCALLEMFGYNRATDVRYIHVFNAVEAPADGDETAVEVLQVPAGGSFSWAPLYPESFDTGLSWCASTDSVTLTRPDTADTRVSVAYSLDSDLF